MLLWQGEISCHAGVYIADPGPAMRLQVHYTSIRPPGDQSGMRLKLTDDVLPFSAGMMMYASFFQVRHCCKNVAGVSNYS